MIDFVEGELCYITEESVTINVQGIGYRLFCAEPIQLVVGEHCRFFTHQHVREDAIQLYGFTTEEGRDLFRLLIQVTGIGPKSALAIVGQANPLQLVAAIQQENLAYLTQFPGVGKKTAQRILLDLKDKVKDWIAQYGELLQPAKMPTNPVMTNPIREAKEALLALGYGEQEILPWLQGTKWPDDVTVDQVIRSILQQLGKRSGR
ncbi:Holliday junction branch migration protein RuvA [Rubeoparvulum massiliense]|uniref:Holliday junction branch migration protein RuvA n=1 Tax=Rubeoparvulum massiliense TaxID=1631346 RepID=UPI00065DFCCD|nr:Holliday junction branch migration protein RuvA [Rubeoparvulum massiliense]